MTAAEAVSFRFCFNTVYTKEKPCPADKREDDGTEQTVRQDDKRKPQLQFRGAGGLQPINHKLQRRCKGRNQRREPEDQRNQIPIFSDP